MKFVYLTFYYRKETTLVNLGLVKNFERLADPELPDTYKTRVNFIDGTFIEVAEQFGAIGQAVNKDGQA